MPGPPERALPTKGSASVCTRRAGRSCNRRLSHAASVLIVATFCDGGSAIGFATSVHLRSLGVIGERVGVASLPGL